MTTRPKKPDIPHEIRVALDECKRQGGAALAISTYYLPIETIPLIASEVPGLTSLTLRKLGVLSPDHIREFARRLPLKELQLDHCEEAYFDEPVYEVLRHLPHLKALGLKRTLSSLTLDDIRLLAVCLPQLRSLTITHAHTLLDEHVRAIAEKFRHLRVLDVTYCQSVSDEAVQAIVENLVAIESLNLSMTRITDAGVHLLLDRLPKLESLFLIGCDNVRSVDPAVLRTGDAQAIRQAIHGHEKLYDVKIAVIGDGQHGKTSIVRTAFQGLPRREDEPSTQAFEVHHFTEIEGLHPHGVHVFDFGGQDELRTAHYPLAP